MAERVDLVCALCDDQASVRDKRREADLAQYGHKVVTVGANNAELEQAGWEVAEQLVPPLFLDRPTQCKQLLWRCRARKERRGFVWRM